MKPGKYGPYVKRGDDTASVPDDLAPDELTLDVALALLAAPKIGRADRRARRLPGVRQERSLRAVRAVGHRRRRRRRGWTSRRCRACSRRWSLERITMDEAEALLQLPRLLGDGSRPTASRSRPTTGATGRTCRRARTTATLDNEERCSRSPSTRPDSCSPSPRCTAASGRNMAAAGPLREFGTDPVSERPVVAKDGRFGVYVTDGETNASIGQRRPHRGHAPRTSLRVARHPPRAGGGEGRRRQREEGAGEEGAAKKAAARKRPAR